MAAELPERMGCDAAELAGMPGRQGQEPRVPQRRTHHILDLPPPERPTATRHRGIVPAGAVEAGAAHLVGPLIFEPN